MKKLILTMIAAIILLPFLSVQAATDLGNRFKGRILLQVQSRGEAWYIESSGMRVFLGRPADAFKAMRFFGLGITNANLERIAMKGNPDINTPFARRFAGRILLQVESHGEAWYINPVDLKRYYLGRPADAFYLMRQLGLGITDVNLALIPIDPRFSSSTGSNSTTTSTTTQQSPQTLNVNIQNFSFNPGTITVNRGDSVKWTNNDVTNHTITPAHSESAAADFGSGALKQGDTYSYKFTKAGTYDYICSIHPSMTGKVIVK